MGLYNIVIQVITSDINKSILYQLIIKLQQVYTGKLSK